jgi:HPt (histidine-containing phosphotransfer) domain-containing protein
MMIHNENLDNSTNAFTPSGTDELYNLSMLEEIGDNEYMAEVLNIFLKETPEELKEMNQALNKGNNDIIATKAHKIKGSAGVIQANKLIELLIKIETIAKKGIESSELKSLVDNTRLLYSNIELSLRKHLKALA